MPSPEIVSTAGARWRRVVLADTLAIAIAVASLAGVTAAADGSVSPNPGPRMNQARGGHTATVLMDGSVLVAGGSGIDDPLASAELYDPTTRGFTATGSLGQARVFHTATRLADGRVLVLGGLGRKPRASVELYDPASREFSRAGRLRQARVFHTATLLDDGRVLVVGGTGLGRRGRPLSTVELYDPVSQRSERGGRLKQARVFHTATLLDDGRVLVVGGFSKRGRPLTSAELYDPVTKRSRPVGPLEQARLYHTATLLESGRVLVVGGAGKGKLPSGARKRKGQGRTASGGTPPTVAELYDPATRRFESVAELERARAAHTSTLLNDGRVLVVSGFEPSVEAYDDMTRSFTLGAPLNEARRFHQTTLLQDGTVLVTGGSSSSGPLDEAELYDPVVMHILAPEIDGATASGPDIRPSPSP